MGHALRRWLERHLWIPGSNGRIPAHKGLCNLGPYLSALGHPSGRSSLHGSLRLHLRSAITLAPTILLLWASIRLHRRTLYLLASLLQGRGLYHLMWLITLLLLRSILGLITILWLHLPRLHLHLVSRRGWLLWWWSKPTKVAGLLKLSLRLW